MTIIIVLYVLIACGTAACHASWWSMALDWGDTDEARHHAMSALMAPIWPLLAFQTAQKILEDARK